jgi:hypothetical protein
MLAEKYLGADGRVRSLSARRVALPGSPLTALSHNHKEGTSRGTHTYFGSLVTLSAQISAERNGGTSIAMIEPGWNSWETADNVFSSSYAATIAASVKAAQDYNSKVTLALGTYNPPTYVAALTNGVYVNQAGASSTEANIVFNQTIRTRVERYYTQLAASVDLSKIWAIRITSGSDPELLYPNGAYWAYDVNAQNGTNRPPTMPLCPFPGWVPGNTSITIAQVRLWVQWYIQCLADVVDWQMRYLRGLGFRGHFEIITPGQGTRPGVWDTEINARLIPTTSVTGRGAVWHYLYQVLLDKSHITAYVSSVADGSGSDDVTLTTDDGVGLADAASANWSAVRYITRVAREYGMRIGGENVGYNSPPAFNAKYIDLTATGMLQTSFRQLIGSNFDVYYWAHSDQMWPALNRMPFSNYSSQILARNPGPVAVPPTAI